MIHSQPTSNLVINTAVGGHYFQPGPQLPSHLLNITAFSQYRITLLGNRQQTKATAITMADRSSVAGFFLP